MTDIERAILTNQMAIMTSLAALHINQKGYPPTLDRAHDTVAKENINFAMGNTDRLLRINAVNGAKVVTTP